MADFDEVDARDSLIQSLLSALSDADKNKLIFGGEMLNRPEGQLFAFLASGKVPPDDVSGAMVLLLRASPAMWDDYKKKLSDAIEQFHVLSDRVSDEAPHLATELQSLSKRLGTFSAASAQLINVLQSDLIHVAHSLAGAPSATERFEKQRLARKSHARLRPDKDAIRREWDRWQRREVNYRSDADFGRKMHMKHPTFTSDRSIAQMAARWRRERRSNTTT